MGASTSIEEQRYSVQVYSELEGTQDQELWRQIPDEGLALESLKFSLYFSSSVSTSVDRDDNKIALDW